MYKLKCPTLFPPPPISSFVPTSKWMPRSSYSPQNDCRQFGRPSYIALISTPPPPPLLSSTSHSLCFYFLPPSCPCHRENPRMEGQRVLLGGGWTHTYKQHFQMLGYKGITVDYTEHSDTQHAASASSLQYVLYLMRTSHIFCDFI
jgi:hypothetical protein